MSMWEKQLNKFTSLIKQLIQEREKGKLRFNRSFIIASDIAQQYFCEKKVEMQYLEGVIETESKMLGAEAHEKLLEDSIKIERRTLMKKIYGPEPIFAFEMLLLAKYKKVIIAGRPDSIIFQNGFPLVVFEYKFSRSRRPFRDHHVQVRTYGTLLKGMGFDTSRLFYAIVMVDPKAKVDKKLKYKLVDAVIRNGPKEAVLSIGNAKVYLNKFNSKDAEQDLNWAIEFWENKRQAIPTNNPNKCRNCEYNKKCKETKHKQLSL
ncbi:MAG: PD-(D/E)XK nuclease family protein [Candidatus Bathyarchaeia archaeon]